PRLTSPTSTRCGGASITEIPRRRLFFFFQAEDGIRDLYVTGVQTCALPIYEPIIAPETVDALPVPLPPPPHRVRNRPSIAGRLERSPASTMSGSPGAACAAYGVMSAPWIAQRRRPGPLPNEPISCVTRTCPNQFQRL